MIYVSLLGPSMYIYMFSIMGRKTLGIGPTFYNSTRPVKGNVGPYLAVIDLSY